MQLATMVDKLEQCESELRVTRSQLAAIIEHLHSGIIVEDENRRILHANSLFCQLWGLPPLPSNIIGLPGSVVVEQVSALLPDARIFDRQITEIFSSRQKATYEIDLTDGRILEGEYLPVYAEGVFHGHLWQFRDITKRRKAEEELKNSAALLDIFFSQSLDGCFFMMLDQPIYWNDAADKELLLDYIFENQRITKVNEAMLEQYGATRESFMYKTPKELFANNIAYGRQLWRQFFDSGRLRLDTQEYRMDGEEIWIEGDYICLYDSHGRITGHFGIQRNITDRKKAELAIRHQAYHDALTGLPNRLLFFDRLNIALSQAEREKRFMALFFIDCYQFKQVNDALGHASGDKLLQILAERLTDCVRKGDTVARIGGDEFVIILPKIRNYDECRLVAQRILHSLRYPILISGASVQLGASIGISVYPNDGQDAATLLNAADKAMYQAKAEESHAFRFFKAPVEK